MSGGGRSRYPFTATQWQELEHQALIFKYMMAGVPVPHDLLFAIKRASFVTSPDLFSRHQQHQHQQIGWNCFQIGLGRKIDPEPGRCRRTDGKKWRCSKEAYPDSKYCERHMHRGKNRSRKPVETTVNHKTPSTLTQLPSSENQLLLQYPPAYDNNNNNQHHHHSSSHGHPYNLYSSKPPLIGNLHSTQQTLTLNPSGSHANPDYRYIYGGSREEADEHAFFSEPSGTIRNFSGSSLEDSSQLITPLTMTSSSSSKHRASSDYSNYLQLQSLTSSDHNNNNNNNNNNIHNLNTSATTNEQVHKQSQGFYVMGSEIKFGYDREHDPEYQEQLPNHQKTTVHRFFDEWPPKPTPDSSSSSSSNHSSVSNTRLSISIPTSHEFPIFNSRAL